MCKQMLPCRAAFTLNVDPGGLRHGWLAYRMLRREENAVADINAR